MLAAIIRIFKHTIHEPQRNLGTKENPYYSFYTLKSLRYFMDSKIYLFGVLVQNPFWGADLFILHMLYKHPFSNNEMTCHMPP